MKNQMSLIIASATLVLTSAILPAGAYGKYEQAGVKGIYPKPTDAIIVARNCGECKVNLQLCAAATQFDMIRDPMGFIVDIAKGKYDAWQPCKWVKENDCDECTTRDTLKDRIREVTWLTDKSLLRDG